MWPLRASRTTKRMRATPLGSVNCSGKVPPSVGVPARLSRASLSRLAPKAWSPEERTLVLKLRSMIARFEETRDIRLLGGYQAGSDPELDAAIRQVPIVLEALNQRPDDPASRDAFADFARFLKERDRRDG